MLVRLLLTLLLALFAAPAMATDCHGAKAAHHEMPSGHDAPAPSDEALAPHACVGCIPPSDWLGARLDTPPLAPSADPVASVTALRLGQAPPPALPPPRRA